MRDETGPGPRGDATGPREDGILPFAPARGARTVLRLRRTSRRHALDRQGPPERRCVEQGHRTRTARGRANPRGISARRRRTERDRIPGGRRDLHPVRRLDPLPADARRIPGGGHPSLPLFRARRAVRTARRGRPSPAARRATGVARHPRRTVETRGHDVPHRRRRGGPSARTEGGGRVEPEPRGRERLGHVRRTRPGSDEHPRRPRHRARGAAPRERSRRCRGDDLREEGLMDEVRLGPASVNILSVVRGLPSERSTVATAIRTTKPDVVALSIGPEELETLRVYHGGPLEPENFEEEIYVAGLSAWEPPVKPPPCFTEAVRIADKRGTRLEALDMDEVTYTENYVDSVSGLEVVFQGRLERRLAKKRFDARTPQEFVLAWDAEVNGPPGFARLQARREAFMAARLRQIAAEESSGLAVIEVERTPGVLAALRS